MWIQEPAGSIELSIDSMINTELLPEQQLSGSVNPAVLLHHKGLEPMVMKNHEPQDSCALRMD